MSYDTKAFYTIEAFVSDPAITVTPITSSNPAFKYFGSNGGWLPLTNGTVNNGQYVMYVIRVWSGITYPSYTTALTTSQINDLTVNGTSLTNDVISIPNTSGESLATWIAGLKKIAKIYAVNTVHGNDDLSSTAIPVDPTSTLQRGAYRSTFHGDAFYIEVVPLPNATGYIGIPDVGVVLKANSGDENKTDSNIDLPTSQLFYTPKPVTFSAGGRNTGQAPQEVLDALARYGGIGGYDPCNKRWLTMRYEYATNTLPINSLYNFYVDAWDGYGNNLPSPTTLNPSSELVSLNHAGPAFKAAKAYITAQLNCGPSPATNPTGPSSAGTTTTNPNINNYANNAMDDKFITNPPNHFLTRDVPLTKRLTGFEGYADLTNNLGYFFSDPNNINWKSQSPNAYKFRFAYNPTTISYNTTVTSPIDWTQASADPANTIGGNTTVSFTLYLNRIADMTELSGVTSSYSKNYPRTLTPTEVAGLINRGTEYDLEFLYRLLNGDPQAASGELLTMNDKSSDFGYITGIPCWIRFHDNLRYKISLSSINVNHVMFTTNMVPMLTTVDIQAMRIPVFGSTDATTSAATANAIVPKIATTTATVKGKK